MTLGLVRSPAGGARARYGSGRVEMAAALASAGESEWATERRLHLLLDDAGFSEQRSDGPSILFPAGGTELVVHVLSPAAGFAGHLLRHMTDKYHEAVDARCQQGRDGDVLPPHGDHLIWLLFTEAALPGLCQTASNQIADVAGITRPCPAAPGGASSGARLRERHGSRRSGARGSRRRA